MISFCQDPFLPPTLMVMLTSILPVGELRGGIVVGACLGLNVWVTVLLSLFTNFLILIPLWYLITPVFNLVKRIHPRVEKWIDHFLNHTQHKHSERFNFYGSILLIIVTALPIPASGAYTGLLIAYIFGIPLKRALKYLFIGMSICAILVAILSYGIRELII